MSKHIPGMTLKHVRALRHKGETPFQNIFFKKCEL